MDALAVIDKLADKLGVTTEYLMETMAPYVHAEAMRLICLMEFGSHLYEVTDTGGNR